VFTIQTGQLTITQNDTKTDNSEQNSKLGDIRTPLSGADEN
jgi:hypothetical protein